MAGAGALNGCERWPLLRWRLRRLLALRFLGDCVLLGEPSDDAVPHSLRR